MAKKRHQILGIGGTFDHFHKGHEGFISFAANLTDLLVIGITRQHLTSHKKYSDLIEPFQKRAQNVKKFCQSQKIKHQIVELNDPYGPTIDYDTNIEAVAVTSATIGGGNKINEIRSGMKLPPLPIYIHDMFYDQSGQTLSAERIRAGKANRKGEVYSLLFKNNFELNQVQKSFFSNPAGNIVDEPSEFRKTTVVVGDVTLKKFIDNNWEFNLGVFDGQTKREKLDQGLELDSKHLQEINNPAGTITPKLFEFLSNWLESSKDKEFLKINGEEDLATVAAILAAPLNTAIYYGQPDQGMVEVFADEKTKEAFFQVLKNN